ncbi:uncharacterized protein LOC133337672 [Musca vetustissima]|uniref:uncharacterized protein LOC133337672 n=1 Tax=Musca vetustissima TaxID=27455 RepID=UPI002AB7246E|nr:uncharacterized protein LOC133337672 [Musca vetustissima]
MDSLHTIYDKETKIWSGPEVLPIHNIECHSIGKILFSQMRLNPRNVIQIDDFDGTSATSGELLSWGIRIALHLKSLNMGHQDVVGIAARNTTHLSSAILGCLFNCSPFHAVNPNFSEDAISHCFGITKPKIIFCDGEDYEKILRLTRSFEPTIYTLCDHIDGVPSIVDLLKPSQMERFYEPEPLTLGANQTFAILSSSGTTGLPKAVNISAHRIMIEHPFINIDNIIYTSRGIDSLSGLAAFIQNCYTGCTRIISRKPFHTTDFVKMTMKYKIQLAMLNPVQLTNLLDCPIFSRENMISLIALQSGGGYISKQIFEKLQEILPQCLIGVGYEITEVGTIAINIGEKASASAGRLAPNIQLCIVNEEGRNLGPNETGEILIRQPYPWSGYYGNTLGIEHGLDALGWYHTGDLGYMHEEEECLYIVDRKEDMLKSNGCQYLPGEIENVIRELPDVVDCCVVGIFDEGYGDVAGALVVKKSYSQLSSYEICQHIRNRLMEPHKRLYSGVYFVQQLPHNCNGKILKCEAREIIMSFMDESSLDR